MFHALSGLSAAAWFGLAILSGLAIYILGIVTNAVLRERGLGVILNGLLMFSGFIAGAMARLAVFGTL